MQNENKELIDKAINRFMCVYDADATSGLFTKRLEDLLEHFLNAKNDYVDYIIFDIDKEYIKSISPRGTVEGKDKYVVAVGQFKNVIMGAY